MPGSNAGVHWHGLPRDILCNACAVWRHLYGTLQNTNFFVRVEGKCNCATIGTVVAMYLPAMTANDELRAGLDAVKGSRSEEK
jgi:hypothetical protein